MVFPLDGGVTGQYLGFRYVVLPVSTTSLVGCHQAGLTRGKVMMAKQSIIESERQERPSGMPVIDGSFDVSIGLATTRAISGLWETGGVI